MLIDISPHSLNKFNPVALMPTLNRSDAAIYCLLEILTLDDIMMLQAPNVKELQTLARTMPFASVSFIRKITSLFWVTLVLRDRCFHLILMIL